MSLKSAANGAHPSASAQGRAVASALPLQVLGAGASQALVGALARAAGITLAGHFGAVGAMLERFLAGEPCDLLILTHAQIAQQVAAGRIEPMLSGELGTVRTAIAVRQGDRIADVSDTAALRRTLLSADAIYFPDPRQATAGIHFARVIDALGIRSEVQERLKPRPNGMASMRDLAAACEQRPVGCTQATEIIATPGLQLAGPLPPEHGLATVYALAVPLGAAHVQAAAGFAQRLWGDDARVERRIAGYEGCTIRPVTSADASAVSAIGREMRREFEPQHSDVTDAELLNVHSRYIASGGHFDVVVDVNGHIIGCCGVVPVGAAGTGLCELRKMFLRVGARGDGLGRRLLDRAIAFARGRGWRRMQLQAAASMQAAAALYRSAGFGPAASSITAAGYGQSFVLELVLNQHASPPPAVMP